MTEKNIKSRIIHKHDTEADWLKSSLIPKQGEIVVYDIDENHNYERFKIGDGKTNVNALPFTMPTKDDISNWNTAKTKIDALGISYDSSSNTVTFS